MAISLGGGGSASVINETIDINSAENLITLEDGRVYLKGGVTTTDTTTYPDANLTLGYKGTSFYVGTENAQPRSLTWDGTYFWVLGGGGVTSTVYKYNASGVSQNVSFAVGGQ